MAKRKLFAPPRMRAKNFLKQKKYKMARDFESKIALQHISLYNIRCFNR